MARFILHVCDRCRAEKKEVPNGETTNIDFDHVRFGPVGTIGELNVMQSERYLCASCTKDLSKLFNEELPLQDMPEPADSEKLRKARALFEELEGSIDIPEKSCTCHLNPPCGDCVEYGHIRECIAELSKVFKGEL